MKIMDYKICFLLGSVFLSVALNAQTNNGPEERHEFSVKEAVEYASKNNVNVKNALLEVQMQQQTNREVTGSAYPQISASGSLVYNFKLPVSLVPAEFFGGAPGTFEELAFGVKWGATGGVSLNQILFDGQVFSGLKARKNLFDFQKKNVEVTEEMIRANIYKVYYQLVVSKTQMELINANIERAAKLQRDTRLMYQNGFAEKLDVDKATVQLANLQTTKENTQTKIDNGYLGLKYLIGVPSADSVILTSNLREEDLKQTVPLDSGYRYEDRPDYQGLQVSKQLSDFDIKRYKALYFPTLSLNGAFQKNAYNNTYDFFSKSGNWYSTSYAGLSLKVPIFSGFSKNANLKKARLQASQLDNQIEDLKLNIEYEVRQSRNNFYTAIRTMDNQRENTALAESVYDQTKKKFESGLASNTDLTNAQTDLIEAQTNYVNALYNAVIAKIDYLKAIGKI
jgi:outer membrane protein TolC